MCGLLNKSFAKNQSVKKFKSVSFCSCASSLILHFFVFGYTEGDIHEHIYLQNKKYRMMQINQCVLK